MLGFRVVSTALSDGLPLYSLSITGDYQGSHCQDSTHSDCLPYSETPQLLLVPTTQPEYPERLKDCLSVTLPGLHTFRLSPIFRNTPTITCAYNSA
ncbi:hypothetical protein J6590_041593 [Homalodisca vitripennis]|nr:hypothetical protein J6590_041593 [Homalodisca vitripennis]